MNEVWVAVTIFVCLSLASLGAMFVSPKMLARHRDDDTNGVIRLIANIFVVMSSLVFSLMINSAKNTYENIDSSVHAFQRTLSCSTVRSAHMVLAEYRRERGCMRTLNTL